MQLADRGIGVDLYEMRPGRMTPAHTTPDLAELVCSNSLRSSDPVNAAGLLKTELGRARCFLLGTARRNAVPAGTALAVPEACEQVISSVSARYGEEFPDLAPSALFEVCSPAGPMRMLESDV